MAMNMKILHLTNELSNKGGGIPPVVKAIAEEQIASGDSAIVAGLSVCSNDLEKQWEPVPIKPFKPFFPLGFIGYSRPILNYVTACNPQLVHLHGLWLYPQCVSLRWQQRNGGPVVISPHGMIDPWALKNSAWKKDIVSFLFAKKSLNNATCLHALCESEYESIRKYGLKNPVAVIPNGIRIVTQDNVIKRYGRKKLLFLGRIHPKKGLANLIRAWGEMRKKDSPEIDNWQLVIAGWDQGGHEQKLQQLCKDMQISFIESHNSDVNSFSSEYDIIFAGARFAAEKEQIIRLSDCFILPSYSEGLPMAVLEAWANQIPVIMTKFCNLPEGFEADAAIYIKPEVESIVSAVLEIMQLSENKFEEKGLNGVQLVRDKFTWNKINQNLTQVYKWCINGGTPPPCIRTE